MTDIGGSDGTQEPPVTQVGIPAGQGVQVGDHNIQHNKFDQTSIETQYIGTQVVQLAQMPPIGQVVAGNVPQEPPAFQPRPDLLDLLRAAIPSVSVVRVLAGLAGVGNTPVAAADAGLPPTRACAW